MKLLRMNCPACAGALEVPDNLTVAHCLYCGNKILLDHENVIQESRDLDRYIELCRISVKAKNSKDVVQYCQRILEIDPKNIEAWLNKSMYMLLLEHANSEEQIKEAFVYFNRAAELAPNDSRLPLARKFLQRRKADQLSAAAGQQVQSANQILASGSDSPTKLKQLRAQTTESLVLAMTYLFEALECDPTDKSISARIKNLADQTRWMKWSDKTKKKIEIYSDPEESWKTLQLREAELVRARQEIEELNMKKGYFNQLSIKQLTTRIHELEEIISLYKQLFGEQP